MGHPHFFADSKGVPPAIKLKQQRGLGPRRLPGRLHALILPTLFTLKVGKTNPPYLFMHPASMHSTRLSRDTPKCALNYPRIRVRYLPLTSANFFVYIRVNIGPEGRVGCHTHREKGVRFDEYGHHFYLVGASWV
jgi:hypothetical protein